MTAEERFVAAYQAAIQFMPHEKTNDLSRIKRVMAEAGVKFSDATDTQLVLYELQRHSEFNTLLLRFNRPPSNEEIDYIQSLLVQQQPAATLAPPRLVDTSLRLIPNE